MNDSEKGTKNPQDHPVFKEGDSENIMDRYDTRKLLLGIQRHLLAILLSSLIFTALGTWLAYKLMTTFTAEAVVLYQEDTPKNLSGGYTLTNLSMSTALDMIKIPSHFQAVKSILGLDMPLKQLQGMVNVPIPLNTSNLIRIVAKGDNANLVVDVANTLAKVSVKSGQEFTQRQLQIALDNYRNQLEIARQKLSTDLQQIEDFKKENQYFEMDAEYATLLKQLSDTRGRLSNANLRYNSMVVEYENLKREAVSLPDKVPVTSTSIDYRINPTRERINTLEGALMEASAKYAPGNPKLKALRDEIESLKAKKKTETEDKKEEILERNPTKEKIEIELMRMQGKVRSSQKIKEDVAEDLIELEKKLESLPQKQIAFAKLLQTKLIDEEQVKYLNKAAETTQLMLNVPKGSIELYQLADKAKPLKDAWWVELLPIIGLFLGTGLGILLALFLEMQDKRLWTAKQVELAYNLPVMMTIPEIPFLNKKNVEDRGLFYMRILSERLERLPKKDHGKERRSQLSLTLTSSVEREGKSMLSYELARYYERVGKKVMLIDFDHRSNMFSEDNEIPVPSIESYLRGNVSIQDIIAEGKPDRMNLKDPTREMKELVKSERMSQLWKTVNSEYDVVIIDAPGIIQDDYALNLSAIADHCIFIVGSSLVSKSTVDESLKELNHMGIKPCGIILNRVLPVYIEEQRTKIETKRHRKELMHSLMFWKK